MPREPHRRASLPRNTSQIAGEDEDYVRSAERRLLREEQRRVLSRDAGSEMAKKARIRARVGFMTGDDTPFCVSAHRTPDADCRPRDP